MRTPGADEELTLGLLFSEGIIERADQVSFGVSGYEKSIDKELTVSLTASLDKNVRFRKAKLVRNLMINSSCGVCSKSAIDAIAQASRSEVNEDFRIHERVLRSLPGKLRSQQREFSQTGGIHACATFNELGELICVREDVGRHNAMDKLVGAHLQQNDLPLSSAGVLLSGRASFELMHKTAVAGIPLVASIGPPSSLAIEVAETFGITLVGFLRDTHLNLYHGSHLQHD